METFFRAVGSIGVFVGAFLVIVTFLDAAVGPPFVASGPAPGHDGPYTTALKIERAEKRASVVLTKGELRQETSRDLPTQFLAVKNNGTKPLNVVFVECAFFHDDQVIHNSIADVTDLQPGQTGYTEAHGGFYSGYITRTECRVTTID